MTPASIARVAGVLCIGLLAAGCGRGRGPEAIIGFLLERGADPLAANGRQQTPLSIAEARSTVAIAALVRSSAERAGDGQ
jgi:ankyrin repeat protein